MGTEAYHETIEAEVQRAYELASEARSRGADPAPSVEIPVAQDMADRVENLLGYDGVADRIRDLEGEVSRERAALELARSFADGELGTFDDRGARIEAAVRTAVALLTEGVVAAPIEGIDDVTLETDANGTEFVRVYYAGPIRSAGGTAQALSVLVADYTRRLVGVDAYEPTDAEIDRTVEEIRLYENETGLQYTPTDEETRHIASACPIMLDGEPTTEGEVDSNRDLERIGSNRGRGGMCLVLAEGIAQKADKLARYIDELEEVEWPWLDSLRGYDEAERTEEEPTEPESPLPDDGYLTDLIAGRPVLGHPSAEGGFRLRYGRARNHGLATVGIHPATMHLLEAFLAPGTQLKTEFPGKAAGVVPVDTVEGPTVRLPNGRVERISEPARARELAGTDAELLDLGGYLVNVGEFVENNKPLVPGAYDQRRWELEMAEAGVSLQPLRDAPAVSLIDPTPERALEWAQATDAPMHPKFTYLFHDLDLEAVETLITAIERGAVVEGALEVPERGNVGEILTSLLIEHEPTDDGYRIDPWRPLVATLGFNTELERVRTAESAPDALSLVNDLAPCPIRAKAPTRIGARMGRPEKSEARELSPAVHALFPVGDAGGDRRSVNEAATYAPEHNGPTGEIDVELNRRECQTCGTVTVDTRCPACDDRTELLYTCPSCDRRVESDGDERICPRCDRPATCVQRQSIAIDDRFEEALSAVDVPKRHLELLKGVKGLTSRSKTPEPLEKGALRAKFDLSVFKDGTIRYDMTDLPVTAVRPAEVDVDVATFRELGYETDIEGDSLEYDDQLVALNSQDVVLSEDAAAYLFRAANFVDELLVEYYGLEPYYDLEDPSDLVGELVLGLAPHTSAAVAGRIVGFTEAAVGYAHPFFHAAKRRNCDGDEDCVMLLLDGLLNFSEAYLPDQRGGSMDAPLVLTSRIDPTEIDDEAHNVDVEGAYPLDLYEAADAYADPDTVDITLAGDAIEADGTVTFEHTDDPIDIAAGPPLSAYKTLESMEEKLDAQLGLARRTRATDDGDVAERVIEGHYLPDLLGNLRAFASQETRCRDCGRKFRRPPLSGSCPECGGTVSLTVYEGMVSKYLETAMEIAEEYDVRPYTRQRLEVLDRSLESLFEDDTDKQAGIADFM